MRLRISRMFSNSNSDQEEGRQGKDVTLAASSLRRPQPPLLLQLRLPPAGDGTALRDGGDIGSIAIGHQHGVAGREGAGPRKPVPHGSPDGYLGSHFSPSGWKGANDNLGWPPAIFVPQ